MYYMGSVEFKRYLFAKENLTELIGKQDLAIRRAYADIHPTRIVYNAAEGRAYSESLCVEDYAIWLIETKDLQKQQRIEFEGYAKTMDKALKELDKEEIILIENYKMNSPGLNQQKLVSALSKLRGILESILGAKEVVACKI